MKQFVWRTGIITALFMMNGCSISTDVSPRTPLYQVSKAEKQVVFDQTLSSIGNSTKHNPNYQKMTLESAEKKKWFKALCYRLWDRQITKDQFVAEGLKVYPDHRYEFEFIAEGMNLQH